MPISAGLREDIAVYRGFIGQQYFINKDFTLTELVLYNLLFYVLCVLRSELWYLVLSFSLLLITLYSIFNAL